MEDLGLSSRTEAKGVLVRSADYGQLVFSEAVDDDPPPATDSDQLQRTDGSSSSSDGEDGDEDRELTPLSGFETPASCYESETVEPEPSTSKADRRRSGPVDYRALNSGSDYRKTSTATAMSGKRETKRSAAPQPTVSKPQKREKLSNPSSEAGNTTSRSKVSTLSNDKPSTSKAGKSAAPQPMQLRLPRAVARPSTSAKAQETVESEAHSSSSDDDDEAAAAGRATKVAKQQARGRKKKKEKKPRKKTPRLKADVQAPFDTDPADTDSSGEASPDPKRCPRKKADVLPTSIYIQAAYSGGGALDRQAKTAKMSTSATLPQIHEAISTLTGILQDELDFHSLKFLILPSSSSAIGSKAFSSLVTSVELDHFRDSLRGIAAKGTVLFQLPRPSLLPPPVSNGKKAPGAAKAGANGSTSLAQSSDLTEKITAWKEKIKERYQVGSGPEHPTAACMIQGQHHYDMLDEARLDAEERRGANLESGLIHPFFGPKRAIGATPDTDAGSGSTLYNMPGKAKTPDMMQALLALQSTTMMLQQQQQQQHQQQPTEQQQQQQHPQPSLGGAPPSEPVSEELVQFAAQHHLEPATAMTISKYGISLHELTPTWN